MITLQTETPDDEAFLRQVYASSRQDEMALVPWPDAQKQFFLAQQFDLQRHHYRSHYPDGEFSLILLDGIHVGRWYVHRGESYILVIDICLLPQFRQQGIGNHLLLSLQNEAKAIEKPIRLQVEPFNRAKHLYLKLGFNVIEDKGVHLLMEWRP